MASRLESLIGGGDFDELLLGFGLFAGIVVRVIKFRLGDVGGFDLLGIRLGLNAENLVIIVN